MTADQLVEYVSLKHPLRFLATVRKERAPRQKRGTMRRNLQKQLIFAQKLHSSFARIFPGLYGLRCQVLALCGRYLLPVHKAIRFYKMAGEKGHGFMRAAILNSSL
jgi:hypothetical protein